MRKATARAKLLATGNPLSNPSYWTSPRHPDTTTHPPAILANKQLSLLISGGDSAKNGEGRLTKPQSQVCSGRPVQGVLSSVRRTLYGVLRTFCCIIKLGRPLPPATWESDSFPIVVQSMPGPAWDP